MDPAEPAFCRVPGAAARSSLLVAAHKLAQDGEVEMSPKDLLLQDNYTEAQVAEALMVTISALRVRRCRGQDHPPYKRIGRLILYPKEDFDAWVKKIPLNKAARAS